MTEERLRVVLVDDELEVVRLLTRLLTKAGLEVLATTDPLEGLAFAFQPEVDVVLSDVEMPKLRGIELLHALRSRGSDVEVVLMTGMSSLDRATAAVKAGAWDYLAKPFNDFDRLVTVLRHAAERRRLRRRTQSLESLMEADVAFDTLVGTSARMKRVYTLIESVAPTSATVLVRGESGTGKELIARALHRNSLRALKPFVAVNCGALSPTLLESELFGHTRGAFTGATVARRGLFVAADGGTLFLDEVDSMAPATQAALLRTLQEGEVRPVGSTAAVQVDVRIVAATQVELATLVSAGRFREDLLFRLQVLEIAIPPLRERLEDLPLLVAYFLDRHARRSGRPASALSEGALTRLKAHSWDGNVRELENALEHAVVLARGETITEDHLPPQLRPTPRDPANLTHLPLKEARQAVVEAFERKYLREMLERHGNNITQCADAAGVARANFRKLLKEYGLR